MKFYSQNAIDYSQYLLCLSSPLPNLIIFEMDLWQICHIAILNRITFHTIMLALYTNFCESSAFFNSSPDGVSLSLFQHYQFQSPILLKISDFSTQSLKFSSSPIFINSHQDLFEYAFKLSSLLFPIPPRSSASLSQTTSGSLDAPTNLPGVMHRRVALFIACLVVVQFYSSLAS